MTSDAEKSFKAKLRAIAKEKNRDPADLWQSLTLERFLARLAKSEYANHFVLKGGILLSKYIEIGRETTDLDFLAQKISNEVGKLKVIFETIAVIDLQDGFSFREIKVNELAHPHMGYPGLEVSMMAYFGKTKFKVAIDIGFGDIVNPVKYAIPLTSSSKGDLFEHSVSLSCYPKEFILAEKLETIIYRGSFNSRMKDFHDLYSVITSPNFSSFHDLEAVILLVFEHRETKLALPIFFTEEELSRIQNFWNNYLRSLRPEHVSALPRNIADVISKMNNWLCSHTRLI
ncbi:MAG: nucleotidyl transferase AbiEii/AbiGii toxin family protein [Verrucomicrobia bacterium]|nr:nucleotidyl transferase AbiEii/AbiGii toxin family protein [Verrucomicrobiota bacterium]MBS0646555.1 nucleotidyl transferase AbiEii/AbiGii toxin family protein [Verrucomicrobiota bacterium]